MIHLISKSVTKVNFLTPQLALARDECAPGVAVEDFTLSTPLWRMEASIHIIVIIIIGPSVSRTTAGEESLKL